MFLRDNTQDLLAMKEVYFGNEYELPDRFEADDVILDCGAHVGTFALACLIREARKIVCVEMDPTNFKFLTANMGAYLPFVDLRNRAIWCGSGRQVWMNHTGVYTAMNHVCYKAAVPDAVPVETLGLDDLLLEFGSVRLLKLDVEGSEFPAILGSKELSRCREIKMEVHMQMMPPGYADRTVRDIQTKLAANGFEGVAFRPAKRDPHLVGHIFARQRG